MRNLIFVFMSLAFSVTISAQGSIGYFPFESELSMSTNSESLVFGEMRLSTNTFIGNLTSEPILVLNAIKKEMSNFYLGLGMNCNFFNAINDIKVVNGYSVHLGSRIKPVKQISKLQVLFEVSPYVNRYFDGGMMRTRLGLAYQFGKRKNVGS